MTKHDIPTVRIDASERQISVTWRFGSVGPSEGIYTVALPVDVVRTPAVALVALPILVAMSRHGGTARLQPAFLAERGVSAVERAALQQAFSALALLVQRMVLTLHGEKTSVAFEVDLEGISTSNAAAEPTALGTSPAGLLFGGGVESLLSLARMRERGAVTLIGLRGPGWKGSNRERDQTKLEYDQHVANQLGLDLLTIDTDAYLKMMDFQSAWTKGAKKAVAVANTVLFSPLVVSMTAPLIASGAIASVHLGSENEHSGYLPGYCLSPEFLTELAQAVEPLIRFFPELLELGKPAIVEELWRHAPDLGRLQHSCSHGEERWCCQCEKCFRSYVLLVIAGVDPASVQLDGPRLLRNLPRYIRPLLRAIASSSYHQKVYTEARRRAVTSAHLSLAALLSTLLPLGAVVRGRNWARAVATAQRSTRG